MDPKFWGMLAVVFIFFLVVVLVLFKASTTITQGAVELRTDLERIQAPIYSPLGVGVTILKWLLSLFT